MGRRKLKIILCLLLAVIIAVISFFIGYKVAYDKIENTFTNNKSETFYATITNINDTFISVQGVEMNDINYRGEFDFEIVEETEIVWRGTPITVSELNVGDCISITFGGYIQETYPAHITDIIKVQLLNDEKVALDNTVTEAVTDIEKPVETLQEMPSDYVNNEIYGTILAEYKDMVENDFYTSLQGTDTYDSSFGEHIGSEIRLCKQNIYYTLFDIDGNGIMELMIAGGERGVSHPTFSPWNYDLYGYDGTKVVHIFPEMSFGYRTNFKLYENGVIEVFYSASAAESGVEIYKVGSDGFSPELVDSFSMVGHLEKDEPVFTYYQNENEITEREYNANIQSYEVPLTTALEWIQIQ